MLAVGITVRTNYDTGPYVVRRITGPCRCPSYVARINGDETPSEPHYHIAASQAPFTKFAPFFLNGYREDGTNVWSDDRLIFESAEVAPPVVSAQPCQLALF